MGTILKQANTIQYNTIQYKLIFNESRREEKDEGLNSHGFLPGSVGFHKGFYRIPVKGL